ncbi:DUF6340 family protein [Maribacter algicola]|uniref:DUF6340 family protein n=1 Tax=Meishania litoralis TaxID=3434685 RepID=A0ACC7LK97_9FLAO
MKKICLNLALGICSLLAISCSNTKQVLLQTTAPSPVMLSGQIKKIGIVNSSEVSTGVEGETKGMGNLLVAQEKWLTEKGKDAAIEGLFDELLKDKRFDDVKLLDSVQLEGHGSAENSIPWSSIAQLCETHNVDAIFALAFYETDTKISIKKSSMLQPNLMRVKEKVPAQELTMETLIENGWRIYSPKSRQVIDEIVFNDQFVSSGKGTDTFAAYQAIGDRKETLIQQSKTSGINYGQRLLPFERTITREYFSKGSENLVLADKLISQGDWEGAGQLWAIDVDHEDTKIRGRSCHNLAVLNEKNDNLEIAFQWASKAYENSRDEKEQDYMGILEKRLEDKGLLMNQMAQLDFAK